MMSTTSWITSIADILPKLPQMLWDWWLTLPDAVPAFTVGLIVFGIAALMGQLAAIVMVLMERKVLSWFTQRKGPNRVGPLGALQTIADGVKLLFKEDIMNDAQDKFLFTLAPAIFLFPVFVMFTLVPFSSTLIGVSLPVGLLALFALSSISVIGVVLAGWASNNKFSLLGGMRSAAQAISYEIPLVLSLLGVVLLTGTMDLSKIIEAQRGGLLHWFGIFLAPVSFLIFYTASLAEVNRVPFDLPEAESELVGGYNTEYSGMKFATFFLAEYAGLFIISAICAAVFFGGYYSPFGGLIVEQTGFNVWLANTLGVHQLAQLIPQAEMLLWMLSKTYVFVYMAMLIRGTLPRLKPDELMGFSWKFLLPVALINVLMIAFVKLFLMDFALNLVSAWVYLGIALLIGIFGIGGFCLWISRSFTKQLQARLLKQV